MPEEPIHSPLQLRLDLAACPARLAAAGEIDASNADHFSRQLAAAIADHRELGLDLSEVSFLESSGLRAILQASSAARRDGGSLLVVAASRPVRRVLEIMGLTALLADGQGSELPAPS
jgi:anti-anti-sigma factor